MRTRVKVCGITRAQDAAAAAGLGVDALGFVFYPASPRYIAPHAAAEIIHGLSPFVSAVGLFVNPTQDEIDAVLDICPLDVLQLHGDEKPAFCAAQQRRVIKAVAIREPADVLRISAFDCPVLLDAKAPPGVYGGTGEAFDWELVREAEHHHPLILAGGLDGDNVGRALAVRQWQAVDVSSGVESSPGIKEYKKMQRFMAAVRSLTHAMVTE